MNIKWNGKGEFDGDFTQEELDMAKQAHADKSDPQLSDLFDLMPDDGRFTRISESLPMVCECECGNILEAPLLRGSKQCCADSLKQMLYNWIKENSLVLLVDGDLDLLEWALWVHEWVDIFNKPKPEPASWEGEDIYLKIMLPSPFKPSVPFTKKKGGSDGEEKETDRRID